MQFEMIRRAIMIVALALLAADVKAAQAPEALLARGESLAAAKKFDEAARIYLDILRDRPTSRAARLGLARVRLWQGRYREARDLFEQLLVRNRGDADAAEGAATASYWSGDYRTAEREFRAIAAKHPDRQSVRRSLAELESASQTIETAETSFVDDDQPFRALRSQLGLSIFSDPLTRWDASAGGYVMNSDAAGRHHAAFALLGNETVLPSLRLTLSPSIGAIRLPDGRSRAIGGLSTRVRAGSRDSVAFSYVRRELLSNATRLYPFVDAATLRWQQREPWLASIGIERDRFSDHNSAKAADAYVLWPFARLDRWKFFAGASTLYRDTAESRFYVNGITGTRDASGSFFHYAYRGAYDPYWTPQNLIEGRLILAIERRGVRATVRLQGDGGVAHDRAVVFWPESDRTPFPSQVGRSLFNRSFSPWRIRLTASAPLPHGLTLDAGYELSATAFYRANTFHAALARRR